MKKIILSGLFAASLVACATTPPPPSVEQGGIAAAQVFAESVEPDCETTEFEVYFGADDTDLSPESRAIVTAMSDLYKTCEIDRIQVTGYADAVGDAVTNLEVSRARAKLVADRLLANGLIANRVDIEAVGEAEAVTENGYAKPLIRKTVVSIETS